MMQTNRNMQLKHILQAIEEAAPFSLQENYDNSGIQFGHPDKEVSCVLVCLDVTPKVVREAIDLGCDLIVSHHPVVFQPLKKITGDDPAQHALIMAIRHDIAIVSAHTNLDAALLNKALADRFGLIGKRLLMPAAGILKKLVTFCPQTHAARVRDALFGAGAGVIGAYDSCSFNTHGFGTFRGDESTNPFVGEKNELHQEEEVRIETIFPGYNTSGVLEALHGAHPYEEVAYDIYPVENMHPGFGSGIIGNLPEEMEEGNFLDLVKQQLGTLILKHSKKTGRKVRTVALCGGAGGFLLSRAMAAGADAFITSDIKYNMYIDAEEKILLVDAGHFETETIAKEILHDILKKKLINFAVLISKENTNPVYYH